MTFFYLTNFSYVKTVLTILSVSQFAIFKNRHVFADPITYIYIARLIIEHHREWLASLADYLYYICDPC